MGNTLIHELTMPKWGLTMQEGTIVEWLVAEGGEVNPETEVVEVETDKSSQSVEITASGALRRIIVPAGEVAPVGALLAVIADPAVSEQEIDAFIAQFDGAQGEEAEAAAEPVAEELQPPLQAAVGENTKPLSAMRKAIAKTVTAGWDIPQFPVTVAIEMGQSEQLYRRLREAGDQITLNDLVIKAVAVALQKFPMANAAFAGDKYILHRQSNIALAVAVEDGLLMPVIKDCQNLSLKQIGIKSHALIERIRAGKDSEEDLAGGNFSISNMGMLGVEEFAALIPPGQAAILAVGAVTDEPIVQNGQVVVARRMRVTLSADHRVVDGAYAARFLAELKELLQTARALEG